MRTVWFWPLFVWVFFNKDRTGPRVEHKRVRIFQTKNARCFPLANAALFKLVFVSMDRHKDL